MCFFIAWRKRSLILSTDAFRHVPTDNVRRKGNAHSALYRSIKQAGGAAVVFFLFALKTVTRHPKDSNYLLGRRFRHMLEVQIPNTFAAGVWIPGVF